MPWRKNETAERECLDEFGSADYLFCHTDVRGFKFNKFVEIEEGIGIKEFKPFRRVYSGHIHFAQRIANIVMLGSPYALTRSDIGNEKGITLLDLKTDKETYFPNTYSPRFIKIKFDTALNMTIPDLQRLVTNNFVDILISSNFIIKAPLNSFLELLSDYRKIDFYPYNNQDEENALEGKYNELYGESFDLIKFVKDYIEDLPYDQETRDKLYNSIVKLKKITEDKINNVNVDEHSENKV